MDITPFELTICGLADLNRLRHGAPSDVISILDPGVPEPPLDQFNARLLKLRFHDVVESASGRRPPQRQDVESIIGFVGAAQDGSPVTHVLIHCQSGVSRSAAAAMLVLACARADLPAQRLMEHLVQSRPSALPNMRMIEIGDDVLGRRGDLIEAVRVRRAELVRRFPSLASVAQPESSPGEQ